MTDAQIDIRRKLRAFIMPRTQRIFRSRSDISAFPTIHFIDGRKHVLNVEKSGHKQQAFSLQYYFAYATTYLGENSVPAKEISSRPGSHFQVTGTISRHQNFISRCLSVTQA